jgi:hypothetical protein
MQHRLKLFRGIISWQNSDELYLLIQKNKRGVRESFIHGIGDGVLKARMLEILKEYDNVQTKDASMHQFGYGAFDVLIWHSAQV